MHKLHTFRTVRFLTHHVLFCSRDITILVNTLWFKNRNLTSSNKKICIASIPAPGIGIWNIEHAWSVLKQIGTYAAERSYRQITTSACLRPWRDILRRTLPLTEPEPEPFNLHHVARRERDRRGAFWSSHGAWKQPTGRIGRAVGMTYIR